MKKIILVLSMVSILLLTGCTPKPSGMSDDAYKYNCKILDVMESYDNADITKSEMESKLGTLKSNLESITKNDSNDLNSQLICSSITSFIYAASCQETGTKSSYTTLDIEKEVKGYLNK